MLSKFLSLLKSAGVTVTGPHDGEPDDRLHATPKDKITPQMMEGLKAFKRQLVELYGRNQTKPEEPPAGE
jgi:RNA:NAD 2'-phosphotransferase (TPT1/KptA family)